MPEKKNGRLYSIKFNPDIPRHVAAMETLDLLGRKKSEFIAMLVACAARHPEDFAPDPARKGMHGDTIYRRLSEAGFWDQAGELPVVRDIKPQPAPEPKLEPARAAEEGPESGGQDTEGMSGIPDDLMQKFMASPLFDGSDDEDDEGF